MISNNMLVLNQDGETLSSNIEVIDLRGYNFVKEIKNVVGITDNFVNININKTYIIICNINYSASSNSNSFCIKQNDNLLLKYSPLIQYNIALPIVVKFNTSLENCKIIPSEEYSTQQYGTISVLESI